MRMSCRVVLLSALLTLVSCVQQADANREATTLSPTIIIPTPTPIPTATQTAATPTDKEIFRETLDEMNKTPGKKICWVGDSITEQGKAGMGNGIGHTTLIQGLYPNIEYFNEGIGGNTTKNIIDRIDSIKAHSADLYVVAAGINDARYNDARGATNTAQYIENINTIVSSLQSTGAEVALVSIFPSFWKDQFSSLLRANTDLRFVEWNNAAKEYAKNHNILFLDAYTNIRKYINLSNVLTLIPDGVHPNYSTVSGKQLYADSILYDTLPTSNYAGPYLPFGSHYYKLVIGDNMNPDKLCGIKNIQTSTPILDIFAQSANAPYSLISPGLGNFDASFAGYYNKANDYPMFMTFSTAIPLQSMAITGAIKTGTNINRGIRNFDLYYSTVEDALVDLNHSSWKLIRQERTTDAVTVNLYPTKRYGVNYMLKMSDSNDAGNTVKLKKISGSLPVRVWTQNVVANNPQYFTGIFSTSGVTSDTYALTGNTPSYIVSWEAEEDQRTIALESFNSSLKNWTLYRSYQSFALKNPADPSWTVVATGNGDGTFNINSSP